ncbi:hypothetical protein CGGC5_v014807 [Colletotrichum fructicola Nara gc5]|uniref:Uncharacterized protein n=1 Tax=Colletotrichum fructicola (strain Nara gc5) TaxID=1213859 RepID=A0A7J6IMT0_COLFN|nr:hypothetical protein CGGC5_v014807 [Colletotrichum fructicola Nara gc5]
MDEIRLSLLLLLRRPRLDRSPNRILSTSRSTQVTRCEVPLLSVHGFNELSPANGTSFDTHVCGSIIAAEQAQTIWQENPKSWSVILRNDCCLTGHSNRLIGEREIKRIAMNNSPASVVEFYSPVRPVCSHTHQSYILAHSPFSPQSAAPSPSPSPKGPGFRAPGRALGLQQGQFDQFNDNNSSFPNVP